MFQVRNNVLHYKNNNVLFILARHLNCTQKANIIKHLPHREMSLELSDKLFCQLGLCYNPYAFKQEQHKWKRIKDGIMALPNTN